MYDLIIIGGGPAGMTATIYAIRKRLNVLLVSQDLGGKSNWRMTLPDVDEYHQVIRGLDVVNKFKQELEYLDFARHMEAATRVTKDGDVFIVETKGGAELRSKAVIIATGARTQRLNVPGEQQYMGKGLSFSALSYAPLFLDKRAIVIGDGELALRSTAELAMAAKHVTLVTHAETDLESPLGAKIRRIPNVEVLAGYQVKAVEGNGFAEGIVVHAPDGTIHRVLADGIFVEKQLIPNTDMVAGLVETEPNGRIIVDCQGRSSMPGLFAAGDVSNSTEQILVAVGDGAKAAIAAYNYLLPIL